MKYKNNIVYKHETKGTTTINFKNRRSMIKYLDKNQPKLNKLKLVYVNFNQVRLPLKQTVWNLA